MACYGEEICAVRFEEGLDDDCRDAVDCFTNLYQSSTYRLVNIVGRTCHNRHLLYIGHRGIGHGGRPISFGCRGGSGLRRDSNRRHDADDPVIVVARYPDYGRIDAHPAVSMYFEARSGELE